MKTQTEPVSITDHQPI